MALSNYNDLVSAIADWLNRDDLVTRIPDFVALAESRLNKTLRVAEMETAAYANLTEGAVELPSDFLEPRRIISSGSGAHTTALQLLSPSEAGDVYASSQSGVPVHYTLFDNTLTTYPNGGSGQVTMIYYAKLPSLQAYGTNWLFTKAPECYLYGALVEASPFMGDDNRLETWATLFQRAVEDVQSTDQRARYATSICRVPGVLP